MAASYRMPALPAVGNFFFTKATTMACWATAPLAYPMQRLAIRQDVHWTTAAAAAVVGARNPPWGSRGPLRSSQAAVP
jgi:hypothetical protein